MNNCGSCNRSALIGGKLTCSVSGKEVQAGYYCDVYCGWEEK